MASPKRQAAARAAAAVKREQRSIANICEVRPAEAEAEWARRLGGLRPEKASVQELWGERELGVLEVSVRVPR